VGTIVVGVDGSASSVEALRFAAREARLRGATLHAVTAWHIPGVAYGGGFAPSVNVRSFESNAQESLDGALAKLGEEREGVSIVLKVREGHPAHVLAEEARGADMLVVGSRGHGGFTGLLLGSVSQQCAHHAPCPVAIVTAHAA